ncbi:hypothetical protein [Radiobacillus sp. PE A8.2]|uniref:hypothetical protein n=1 Tax=Radiobacillus sp. PE A8.2 TaxID=3380349 RepID=UPI00389114C8
METNALFYKMKNGTVTSEDYLAWSYVLLSKGKSSPSLNMVTAFSLDSNIFEVESYVAKALGELRITEPETNECARGYIRFLANKILTENDDKLIFNLAQSIFRIVATELDYPDDLFVWYEISELIDRIEYDNQPFWINNIDVKAKIIQEAKALLKV